MNSGVDEIQRIKETEERAQLEIDKARKETERTLRELEDRHKSEIADLRSRLEKEFQRSHSILVAKTQEYREKVTKEARQKAASLKLGISEKEIKQLVNDIMRRAIGD
ncbi:MAG: hypothetical protein M1267_00925 [Candidatus Thermoplasmatota archaeon]|jgi:vacuolar-type H+-ATPase subunit H|nr:hypothetical protein [Candidatus Thermoplasmatota archaeon]MCL5800300.1 hypothetical protein [Candidatus Thermoplasmatota archaeon]